MQKTKLKLAFVSTYPPYQCGIATFSQMLIKNLEYYHVKNQIKVVAITPGNKKYGYPPRVFYEIKQNDKNQYIEAANFLNQSPTEVVVVEHEYGIYGGKDGEYIIHLLENINRPVVLALHSVLCEHSLHRKEITQKILDLSSSIIVMTKLAKKNLLDTFRVDSDKIQIIPHGTPNIRFDEKEQAKELLSLKNKQVMTTFGLLNEGKGIEFVIEKLDLIAQEHPDIIYLIIGVTHPEIFRKEKEKYRQSLIDLGKIKGVSDNLHFINRFLDHDELIDYLKATDIYVAPQKDLNQAFSGTIAYSLGCGCAVISSPISYAKEVLAGGRGVITNPEAESFANEIKKLLGSPENAKKIALSGYRYARKMVWPAVSWKYLNVVESNLFMKNQKWINRLPKFRDFPPVNYIKNLTDEFGIIQHSKLDRPNMKFGYSIDDQARALLVTSKLMQFPNAESKLDLLGLTKIYFNFLKAAIDNQGNIHNFFNEKKEFIDDLSSPEGIARSFWALASLVRGRQLNSRMFRETNDLLKVYRKALKLNELRPIAYAALGFTNLGNKSAVNILARELTTAFKKNANGQWVWFERKLSWANAILPYALLKAYRLTGKNEYSRVALDALSFLEKECVYNGIPNPIGHKGFSKDQQRRLLYDQQSIDVADMILLYNEAFSLTRELKYRKKASQWMGWYYGNNINEVMVYNPKTQGIYDAVTKNGVNLNQGAESILTYLMAYISFSKSL